MTKKGIDVSYWQGNNINWESVKNEINYAIIRAGYQETYDSTAERNMSECERLGIPFGLYWFSYATSKIEAVREAERLIELADRYNPTYPLYFDYEYDSVKYSKKRGVTPTAALVKRLATCFCETVEQAGYFAGIYSNLDFINQYYGDNIFDRFSLWYAQYPTNTYGDVPMHQYSSTGTVSGISGNVDMNYAYIDFPAIIAGMDKPEKISKHDLIMGILAGDYGTGETRKQNVIAAGHDYETIQNEINYYYELADACILGTYGNGDDRKNALEKLGADYDAVQYIVNIKMA